MMRSMISCWCGMIALLMLCVSPLSAAVLWNEASQGDLSGDLATPTDVGMLGVGSHTVSGKSTAGRVEDLTIAEAPAYPNLDADVWKLTIPSGHYLNKIMLASYATSNPHNHTGGTGGTPGGGAFFAVQSGGQVTAVIPDGSDLLGGTLIGEMPGAQQADNVLDNLGAGLFSSAPFNVPTFSGALGAGTYTFWYQEGPMDTRYTLDFQVSTVPEPGTMAGLTIMALILIPSRLRLQRGSQRQGMGHLVKN